MDLVTNMVVPWSKLDCGCTSLGLDLLGSGVGAT